MGAQQSAPAGHGPGRRPSIGDLRRHRSLRFIGPVPRSSPTRRPCQRGRLCRHGVLGHRSVLLFCPDRRLGTGADTSRRLEPLWFWLVYLALERRRGQSGSALDLHPREGFMLRCVDNRVPIGEFSERSGLSPKRLRSCPAGGLLVSAAIDSASGYPYYFPDQLREANASRATPALHVRTGLATSESEDQTRSTIDLDQGGNSRARIWP